MLSEHDEKLCLEYLYHDLMVKTLENDLKVIQHSKLKVKQPYEELIHQTIQIIRNEYKTIKYDMNKYGVRVYQGNKRNEYFINYTFCANGKSEERTFWNAALKLEVAKRLKEYFTEKKGREKTSF